MAVVSQVVTPEVVTHRRATGALLRSALRLRRTQIGLGLVLFILAIAIVGPRLAELFTYPGDSHLFTDSSLPSYDPAATALVLRRSVEFLDKLG